jgi:hypothetical protein
MLLTEREERLVQTIRALPEGAADQIMTWASRLADLSQGKPLEWSDSWTEEDLRDATASSLRRFEEVEPEAR